MGSSNSEFLQKLDSVVDILKEKNDYVKVHGKSLLRNDTLYKVGKICISCVCNYIKEKNDYVKVHGKSLLQNDTLYKYTLETTVYPHEHECLREIRLATEQHPLVLMAASPDEVQLLQMLLKAMNAKTTIEVGVFTGYSLLATALALPDDGKMTKHAYKLDRHV